MILVVQTAERLTNDEDGNLARMLIRKDEIRYVAFNLNEPSENECLIW